MVRAPEKAARPPRTQVQRRMESLAAENVAKRGETAVRRVLELLGEDSLTQAAAKSRGGGTVTLDCGVLAHAWADSRVTNRIHQLERQGITVERQTVASRFGEADLKRERLVITF